jgi:hypothetical protein
VGGGELADQPLRAADNIDFGITARPLTKVESALLGDVPSIPFTMVPVGVAYNVRLPN